MSSLNKLSFHLIDWTRVGELIRSRTHKYSCSEILSRICIAMATTSPLLLDRTNSYQIVGMECLVMFVIFHGLIISPLIWKRYQMKKKCENQIILLKGSRCECIPHHTPCVVCDKIDEIMASSAKNEKSSATWGLRYRLLQDLSSHQF